MKIIAIEIYTPVMTIAIPIAGKTRSPRLRLKPIENSITPHSAKNE